MKSFKPNSDTVIRNYDVSYNCLDCNPNDINTGNLRLSLNGKGFPDIICEICNGNNTRITKVTVLSKT